MLTKLIATLIILLPFCLKAQKAPSEKKQKLEELHWIIERSPTKAIKDKFEQTMKETNLPTSDFQLKDGSYYGESPFDDYGYKHLITFEVKDGEITNVDYNEVKEDGHGKQEDESYCKRMQTSDTNPSIAYPLYEEKFRKKQRTDKLDAVSGATYSMYRFKLAVAYAILNAQD